MAPKNCCSWWCDVSRLLDRVTLLGACVRAGKFILPELAHMVITATLEGEITTDDANAIYMAYATGLANGDYTRLMSYGSFRTQCSKLRQIIKVCQRHGSHATKLFKWACQYAVDHNTTRDYYTVMVTIARIQLRSHHKLSRRDVWRAMT